MRLVSRSELARIAGVSPSIVTRHCNRGALVKACQGKRVDLDHPAAQAYLRSKDVDPATVGLPQASRPASVAPARPRPDAPPLEQGSEDSLPRDVEWDEIERFVDHRSLRELARRFKTAPAFGGYLDALRKYELAREKRLKNDETDGKLVSRELVQIHVIGLIRGLARRLLRDAPKTLAKEVYAMALSGRPIEDAERAIRDGVGSQILIVKTKIVKTLGGEGPAVEDDAA